MPDYREWHIEPAYIGYEYFEPDFDSAPDAPRGQRCGSGRTVEDCQRQIDEHILEEEDHD